MKTRLIEEIEKKGMREQKTKFSPGDTIRVHVKIKEGDKERIQAFQGVVIQHRGSGIGATFTVRRVTSGIGVERIFPLHSPNLSTVELVRRGRVRRARLFYQRRLTGKSARIKELETT